MKKFSLLLAVLAIVAMAGWQVYKRVTGSAVEKSTGRPAVSVAVEVKPIERGVIRDIGVFTGSLEAKSQFVVASKVAGWLKKLVVNIGDEVSRNQVIAIVDDEEFAQQVEQARAELEVAKANAANCASDLDIARREYERAQALREKTIVSVSELDASEAAFNACQTRYKVSVAQVAQKDAALKAADVRLSYTKVQAFWEEGDQRRVVGERFVDEGALLQVNEPIVSVLENNPLVAVVHVIERDYPKVKLGQEAVVTTGIINGELAEITEPQISGLVVTMGNHLLEDGSDIVLPKNEPQRKNPPGVGIDYAGVCSCGVFDF